MCPLPGKLATKDPFAQRILYFFVAVKYDDPAIIAKCKKGRITVETEVHVELCGFLIAVMRVSRAANINKYVFLIV